MKRKSEVFLNASKFKPFAVKCKSEFIEKLRALVELESPTNLKVMVDAAGELVASWFVSEGGRLKRQRRRNCGDILQIDFDGGRGKRVLLLGHLDTVWELGTLARRPFRRVGEKIYGPGAFDMKFGIVQMLFGLRALKETGRLPSPVTILLNSNEETGSHESKAIIERIARKCSAVLVFEPSGDGGACKTARKGVGVFQLRVDGVAAHAGLDFDKGASAIVELAKQIARISEFSDLKTGLTVNPGIIRGGTRTNVVAEFAEVDIDVRTATNAQVSKVEKLLACLRPYDKRCKLSVTGGMNRGPFERNAATQRLFGIAKIAAQELGFDLGEVAVGGASDGNFTAALGIPTLDGLGAVGDGAHAAHEHVLVSEIANRVALTAALIERVAQS